MTKKHFFSKKETGERLRLARKHLGKTQRQIAEELGMDQSNIARIEQGLVSPSMFICHHLKGRYNININWLLDGEGEMVVVEGGAGEKSFDFAEYTDEVQDLLFHLQWVPDARIAVLKYFSNYKLANKKKIMEFLEKNQDKMA